MRGPIVCALAVATACIGPTRQIRIVDAPAKYCSGSRCVSVSLTPDGEYGHGRFRRQLEVWADGRRLHAEEMAARWARAVRMNLYAADGKIVLRECEYSVLTYVVDLDKATVEVGEHGTPTGPGLRFLGSFDEDTGSRWRFLPASERGELPLPEPER